MTLCAVVGLLVGAMFFVGLWARRGEHRFDRPGERSVAVFNARGVDSAAQLLAALSGRLRALGVTVGRPSSSERGGVEVNCVVGRNEDCLAMSPLDDEGFAWCALSLDASSGGPASRVFIEALHEALSNEPGVVDLRWRRRESHFGFGPMAADAAGPFDGVTDE